MKLFNFSIKQKLFYIRIVQLITFCFNLYFCCRQLCMLLSAEDIYRSLAELLLQESNLKFARLMVETLNTILLTTSELFELRNRLRNLSSQVIYGNQIMTS